MQILFRATGLAVRVTLCVFVVSVCAIADELPVEIAIENRPSVDVMYKVHVGPYWRAGQVFAEAGAIVADHAEAGPVYCRYLDDPASVSPSRLRTEIGFFVSGAMELPAGFTGATMQATRCATLIASGSYGTTQVQHRRLFAWIDSEGWERAGKIMEVYPQADGIAAEVKVCVPVRPRELAPVEAPPPPPSKPYDVLLAEKDFAGAGAALFRDVDALTPTRRRWLSGVVDRLKVIRVIVAGRYGTEAGDVIALIAGVADGVPDVLAEVGAAALAPDADAQKASDIHRDLDRLMVRVHLKSLSAVELYEDLTALMLDTEHLVHKHGDLDDARVGVPQR